MDVHVSNDLPLPLPQKREKGPGHLMDAGDVRIKGIIKIIPTLSVSVNRSKRHQGIHRFQSSSSNRHHTRIVDQNVQSPPTKPIFDTLSRILDALRVRHIHRHETNPAGRLVDQLAEAR